jgi:DNA-directed RNA polymerase sigma subunit (sigma70/sigma32)
VTKERVRQIQNKALEKLRLALEELQGEPVPESSISHN